MEDDLTPRQRNELFYAAAGQTGLLGYVCPTPECRTTIYTTLPVDLRCERCGNDLVGRNII